MQIKLIVSSLKKKKKLIFFSNPFIRMDRIE